MFKSGKSNIKFLFSYEKSLNLSSRFYKILNKGYKNINIT